MYFWNMLVGYFYMQSLEKYWIQLWRSILFRRYFAIVLVCIVEIEIKFLVIGPFLYLELLGRHDG